MKWLKKLLCCHVWFNVGGEIIFRDSTNGDVTKVRNYKCIKCEHTKQTKSGGYLL